MAREDRPLDDTNTTVQLEKSRDWIAFTLAQPMDADPGTKWAYNSGGSMLLSGIIQAATGQHIDEYAREHLFQPLGITDFHWKKTPTGHPDTEGGLYLSAHDLAKIGYYTCMTACGTAAACCPPAGSKNATTRHAKTAAPGWDYGYQWWLTTRGGVDIWAGRGFGGQLLLVIPSRDIVAVVNAWNVFGDPVRGVFDPLVGNPRDALRLRRCSVPPPSSKRPPVFRFHRSIPADAERRTAGRGPLTLLHVAGRRRRRHTTA